MRRLRSDIPHLDSGRALRLDEDMRLGAVLRFYQTPDLAAGFVIANDGDERCGGSDRIYRILTVVVRCGWTRTCASAPSCASTRRPISRPASSLPTTEMNDAAAQIGYTAS